MHRNEFNCFSGPKNCINTQYASLSGAMNYMSDISHNMNYLYMLDICMNESICTTDSE